MTDETRDYPRPTPRFTDADIEAILGHAIELDRRADAGLRLDQLHAVADEIGVSRGALERAIAARLQGEAVASSEPGWRRSRPVTVLFGVAAAVLGVVTGMLRDSGLSYDKGTHWEAVLATVLLIGTSVVLVAEGRDGRRAWTLQLRLAAIWLGFLVGFSVVFGVWDDAVLITSLFLMGASVIAALVPWARRRVASRTLSRFLAPEAA